MKTYWSIQGPSGAPQTPCVAFDKLDGQNLRFRWSKKKGWHQFGTRRRLFGHRDEEFADAIPMFMDSLAEGIEKVIRDNKAYRSVREVTAFCEYWGPSSFCGFHKEGEQLQITLIDVAIHKKGIVLPQDFLKYFGHLQIPQVLYEGNFTKQFVQDVWDGKYGDGEGVVAKGVNLGKKKNPQHGLWMRKCKTAAWMEKLRLKAETDATFKSILEDNEKEQAHD